MAKISAVSNPYQDVIDWLRSPAGEQWSETRLKKAQAYVLRDTDQFRSNNTPVTYSARCVNFYGDGLVGVFSLKPQSYYTEEGFEEYARG